MQAENGIIYASNMSGEMHMLRRRDAKLRYSAAYPTGAERIVVNQVELLVVLGAYKSGFPKRKALYARKS